MIATLFFGALVLCMVAVILYDMTRYIIPNNLNLLIVLLWGMAVFLLPIPLKSAGLALAAAVIVLAVGMGIFALGLMGGGDIKLLAALALWTGWGMTSVNFIILTAIAGGLLVVVILLARIMLAPLWARCSPTHAVPRLLTRKQPVAYGLPIAAAFLWLLATHQIAGLSA